MFEFSDQSYLFTVLTVIAAGIIRGFTGFGSAMVMAPVLLHLIGPAPAVATTVLLELCVSAQLVPSALKKFDLKDLVPLGIGALVGTPVGLWIVLYVDPEIVRRIVSLTVLSFVLILGLGWRYKGTVNAWASGLVGIASGILTGATSMGGPPVILYMMSGPNTADRIRSTIILFFVVSASPTLIGLIWAGVVNGDVLFRVVTLAPPFLLAAWAGSKGFHIASEKFFRRLTLGLLALIAVASFFA